MTDAGNEALQEADDVETLDELFEDEGDGLPEAVEAAEKPAPETKGEEDEDAEEDSDDAENNSDEGDGEEEDSDAEEDAAPPAEEDPKTVPVAALIDERRKARALQEELEKLKNQYAFDDENAPDPTAEPESYKAYVRNQIRQEEMDTRIVTSRSSMLEKHNDYTEMETTFGLLAVNDPSLVEQMKNHPEPARFAYETAKGHLDKQRAAIRAELEAELLSKQPKEPSKAEQRKASAVKVPNLTKATPSGSNSTPADNDEGSLEELFADQKY